MRNRRKSNKKCAHSEAVVTTTGGIHRTVCMTCGAVSIQYDHTVCTEWPESVLRVVEAQNPLMVGVVNR